TGRALYPRSAALCPLAAAVEDGQIVVDLDAPDEPAGGEGNQEVQESVGPVLYPGARARGVITAIRSLNSEVQVLDRGETWHVLVPGTCQVTRAAIEAEIGGHFKLPDDLERLMASFRGQLTISEEEARWETPPSAPSRNPG